MISHSKMAENGFVTGTKRLSKQFFRARTAQKAVSIATRENKLSKKRLRPTSPRLSWAHQAGGSEQWILSRPEKVKRWHKKHSLDSFWKSEIDILGQFYCVATNASFNCRVKLLSLILFICHKLNFLLVSNRFAFIHSVHVSALSLARVVLFGSLTCASLTSR